MAIEILGRLFISYSHIDKSHMSVFKKHLEGMLRNKVEVWSDDDISKGVDWDVILRDNLHLASSALILASADYLVSSWCREELEQLVAAQRAQRVRKVFWIQLRPCGWQQTGLSNLQSFPSNVDVSIDEWLDNNQRQRAILQLCEEISAEILHSLGTHDVQLASVRRLLLRDPNAGADLNVTEVLSDRDFSIVCKGVRGSDVVAVKVLKWTPLKKIGDDLLRVARQRKQLDDPLFLRLLDVFQITSDIERRTVFVSEYVPKENLLINYLDQNRPNFASKEEEDSISIDKAVVLLRRMANGLLKLHQLPYGKRPRYAGDDGSPREWENAIGLLRAHDIYYDDDRFRVPSIGISSFLWNTFDYTMYEKWVDSDSKSCIAPEQKDKPIGGLTRLTDQYMLGRLAIELLERSHFQQILDRESASVDDFWKDPRSFVKQPWANNHRQLWDAIERMIRKDPGDRYPGMEAVAKTFRFIEQESRALAKQTYQGFTIPGGATTLKLKDNDEFFDHFYKIFFANSEGSEGKFQGVDPHKKLMESMVAVLNFSPGNKPTSLDEIARKHSGHQISDIEFRKFHDSFLETLEKYVPKDGDVWAAWDELFTSVTDYMISECRDSLNVAKTNDGVVEA
jgi:hemoglobin-like flavoprotein